MEVRLGSTRQGRRRWAIAFAMVAFALATSPARAADPVIAAAGDIACAPSDPAFNGGNGTATQCRQMYTSDLLLNNPLFSGLSAVLPLGDLQYENGTLAKFQAAYDPSWGRVNPISRPAIGNHEESGAGYYEYFNQGAATGIAGPTGLGYYSFDVGAWHLIALNTNCHDVGGCHTGSPQERWLQADLAANRTSCTLAYWHEPFFSSTKISTAPGSLWKDLHAAGAEVILSGHSHNYERFAPQTPNASNDAAYGVRQFVVGTGGRSLYPFTPSVAPNSEARIDTSFGVLRMTLRSASYEWQFVSETGRVEDSGSRACHGPPPAPPSSLRPGSAVSPPSRPSKRSGVPLSECTVVGTSGDDVLQGTRRRDVICGLGGDDEIRGGAGNDILSGGSGNDDLLGGSADDRVLGGTGSDRILGGRGSDLLWGGRGRDLIYGGAGNDRLLGQRGNDRIVDSAGSDWIYGDSGNDVIVSALPREGRDLIDGGPGRDRASVGERDRAWRVERFFGLGRAARPPHHAHHH